MRELNPEEDVSGETMVEYKNFFKLEEAINITVRRDEGEGEKYALKTKIGYILKSAGNCMKGVYLIENKVDNAF